jgi:hypothetical protein
MAATHASGLTSLVLTASAPVASRVSAEASAQVGATDLAMQPASDVRAFAIGHGRPDLDAARALLAGHDEISEAFDASLTNAPLALFALGGSSASGDFGSILLETSADLAVEIAGVQPGFFDQAVVGFFDPVFTGNGFESLAFRIEREGETLLEETFDNLASALLFFDDELLGLGDATGEGIEGDLDLRFALALRSGDPGASFSFASAVGISAIPEPSTAVLLACGLILLARRRALASSPPLHRSDENRPFAA